MLFYLITSTKVLEIIRLIAAKKISNMNNSLYVWRNNCTFKVFKVPFLRKCVINFMLTSQGTRVERLFYIRVSTAVVLPKTTESLSKMYVFCNKEKC